MSAAPGGVRLGEILVEDAGLSRADLARGLALARSEKTRLGSALVGMGLLSADQVATALARQKGVASARDKHLDSIDGETIALISAATAKRLCAVPVGVVRGDAPELVVAMRDPDDAAAIAELERESGYKVRPAVACEARLREIVDDLRDDPTAHARRASAPTRPPVIDLTPLPRPPPGPMRARDPSAPPPAEPLSVPLPPAPPPLELPSMDGIDLTPPTLELPAADAFPLPPPVLPAVPAPPAQPGARPPMVSNDLELAEVPRVRRLSQAPTLGPTPSRMPPSAISLAHAPPVGSSVLDERPHRSIVPGWFVQILGLGVSLLIGTLTYDHCRDSHDSGGPVTGTPVHGSFHDDKLGLTLRLPGSGWYQQDGMFGYQLPQSGASIRADFFMRGDDSNRPDNAALIMRVTQAGAFPAIVTPDQIQAGLDGMEEQTSKMSNGAFTLSSLKCKVVTLGPRPLGRCDGDGDVHGSSYDITFYMWIPTTDDALVLVWFDRDEADEQPMSLVRSIQLD